MVKSVEIPKFGVLSGLKVLVNSVATALPFCAEIFAEMGADVIMIEPPKGIDVVRWATNGWGEENDRRNIRSMSLDVLQPEGKEVFLKLIKNADIWLESSKGGQWKSWGYTDEFLWEYNPKLVITHLSGFGQSGVESYVKRAGYDQTIQAFSGMMVLNGFPDRDPVLATPYPTDFYAGLFCFGSSIAAYTKVKETGIGESIDVAQYECALRCMGPFPMYYLQERVQEVRLGSRHPRTAGVGYYTCKDGKGVYCIFIGVAMIEKLVRFLGLEYGSEEFPEGIARVLLDTKGGPIFQAKLIEYFESKTALEVEQEIGGMGLPCARVMDYEMTESDPHYIARESYTEWETLYGEKVKGVNTVPKFKNYPSQIWRGAPSIGLDNEDILSEIGLDNEEIKSLYDKKILKKSDIVRALSY